MFVNWDIDLCLNFMSCVHDSQYMYKPTTNLRVSGTIYKNDKISCNWHRFTAEICPNMLWLTLRKFLVWNINHDLTDYHTDFKPVTLSLLLYTRSTLHAPELRCTLVITTGVYCNESMYWTIIPISTQETTSPRGFNRPLWLGSRENAMIWLVESSRKT